jgi:hypothetical protein
MIDCIGISKDMVGDLEQIKCLLAKHWKGLELLDWNYLILDYIRISKDIITKTPAGRPPSLFVYALPVLPIVTPPLSFCATQCQASPTHPVHLLTPPSPTKIEREFPPKIPNQILIKIPTEWDPYSNPTEDMNFQLRNVYCLDYNLWPYKIEYLSLYFRQTLELQTLSHLARHRTTSRAPGPRRLTADHQGPPPQPFEQSSKPEDHRWEQLLLSKFMRRLPLSHIMAKDSSCLKIASHGFPTPWD